VGDEVAWVRPVMLQLDRRYGGEPYRVVDIRERRTGGESPDLALDVTLQGSTTGSTRTVALEGWARDVESLSDLGDVELQAFVMLLHANLDEMWSMTGGGD
jgi:hypothetical protein